MCKSQEAKYGKINQNNKNTAAGKLRRSKLGLGKFGLGKLGSGKVGRWFCTEAVNSVETLSDPKSFAAYVGLLLGPNCN